MPTPPPVATRGPQYRLFDSGTVGTAAFFCTLAGAILITINYVRLGKVGKATLAATLGLLVTVVMALIKWSWNTPPASLERLEYDAFQLAALAVAWLGTWKIAEEEQGDDIRRHVALGGQLSSRWMAFWIAIATWAVLIAGIVVIVLCLAASK